METNVAELIRRFVQLNKNLAVGYIRLTDYLETYLALDLLSDREFQPIVLAISALGIDLFFVLGVVFGLRLRIDEPHFSALSGHLDLGSSQFTLRCPAYPELVGDFQNCADRVAARSRELISTYLN